MGVLKWESSVQNNTLSNILNEQKNGENALQKGGGKLRGGVEVFKQKRHAPPRMHCKTGRTGGVVVCTKEHTLKYIRFYSL